MKTRAGELLVSIRASRTPYQLRSSKELNENSLHFNSTTVLRTKVASMIASRRSVGQKRPLTGSKSAQGDNVYRDISLGLKCLNYLPGTSLTGLDRTIHISSPHIRSFCANKMHIHEGLRNSHQPALTQSSQGHDGVRCTFYPIFLHPFLLQDLQRLRDGLGSARRSCAEHRRNLREHLGLPLCSRQARPRAAETGDDEAREGVLVVGLGAGIAREPNRANDGIRDAGEVEVAPPWRGVDEKGFGVIAENRVGCDSCFVGWKYGVEDYVAIQRCGR
jgi:hypothetical protein